MLFKANNPRVRLAAVVEPDRLKPVLLALARVFRCLMRAEK